jgi:MoaA/NifB/PqqE/SkfB family radical SAM enzyme
MTAKSNQIQAGPFWNKLPRLLNMARSRMNAQQRGHVLDYEPIHLHVNPAETHPLLQQSKADSCSQVLAQSKDQATPAVEPVKQPPQRLAVDNFRFLLEQVPAVRTIEFSGANRDPLENSDLLKMVDYARKFNGAESTIYTDGLLLPSLIDPILKSRLNVLSIRMHAHRPSEYALLTQNPPTRFVALRDNVALLAARKKTLASKVHIELCMTVDIHNFRDMPEMIRFAEEIGVDGVRFENYLSDGGSTRSDRTLYTNQIPVDRFLDQLKQVVISACQLRITLPVPLDPDMSDHRYCVEPYTTVSVDAEFNVSVCSRQLLQPKGGQKIWDPDFFNSCMYKWSRGIYGRNGWETERSEVPEPCRSCPRNMPALPPCNSQ